MVWGLEFELTDIPGIIAALGFIGLGIWVFALDPGSRLHRTFGLLSFVRGGFLLAVRLGEWVWTLMGRMAGYFDIAIPFAILAFALAYRDRFNPDPKRRFDARRVTPWILVAGVVAEIAYFLDHDVYLEGPLFPVFGTSMAAFGIFGLILARTANTARKITTRRAALLGSFAFTIEIAYQGTWQSSESITEIITGFDRANYLRPVVAIDQLLILSSVVLALVATGTILRGRDGSDRFASWYPALIAASVVVGIGLAVGFALALDAGDGVVVERWIGVHFFVGGLYFLASLVVLTYAVLKQRLFNINWKLNRTVRGTTLAGVFVALLFTLSEGLQVVFQQFATTSGGLNENIGSILSVVGAGIVVFVLHPVQRFAERVARQTVPNSKPVTAMSHPERVALYREQAELAWLDGQLKRKERLLLDGLRARLDLSIQEAADVERAAMQAAPSVGLENRSVATTGSRPRTAARKRRRS
jgi:hypothetical protein